MVQTLVVSHAVSRNLAFFSAAEVSASRRWMCNASVENKRLACAHCAMPLAGSEPVARSCQLNPNLWLRVVN